MELDNKHDQLLRPYHRQSRERRKDCNDLIEFIQKQRVIHVFTKILYSSAITMSEQILIEEFSEAWKKYKARNVYIDREGIT